MSELAVALLLAALIAGPAPSAAVRTQAPADAASAVPSGQAACAATAESAVREPQRKGKRNNSAKPDVTCAAAAPVSAAK